MTSANPFNEAFSNHLSVAQSIASDVWYRYSNIVAEFSTTPLPEEPEESFKRVLGTVRFDEEIWGTEEAD